MSKHDQNSLQGQPLTVDQSKIVRILEVYDRFHQEAERLRLKIRHIIQQDREGARQKKIKQVINKINSVVILFLITNIISNICI